MTDEANLGLPQMTGGGRNMDTADADNAYEEGHDSEAERSSANARPASTASARKVSPAEVKTAESVRNVLKQNKERKGAGAAAALREAFSAPLLDAASMAALAGLLKPQAVPSGVESMLQRLMEQQQQQQQQIAALMLQQQMSHRFMGSGFAPQGGMGVAYTSPLSDAAAWPLGGSLAPPSHQGPLISDQVMSGWPFGGSLAPASQQGPLGGPFAPPRQQVSPFLSGSSVPEQGSASPI